MRYLLENYIYALIYYNYIFTGWLDCSDILLQGVLAMVSDHMSDILKGADSDLRHAIGKDGHSTNQTFLYWNRISTS